ncbi:hypothetical protein OC835_007301 [Tilletia horrida]|nr:hypothetical protein OC835_007301 [Tilletia horrida]
MLIINRYARDEEPLMTYFVGEVNVGGERASITDTLVGKPVGHAAQFPLPASHRVLFGNSDELVMMITCQVRHKHPFRLPDDAVGDFFVLHSAMLGSPYKYAELMVHTQKTEPATICRLREEQPLAILNMPLLRRDQVVFTTTGRVDLVIYAVTVTDTAPDLSQAVDVLKDVRDSVQTLAQAVDGLTSTAASQSIQH